MKVEIFFQNGYWWAQVDEPKQAWVSFGDSPADAARRLFDIPDVLKFLATGVAA
jgi:predicted RNase H-like HicB family nuclease